MKEAIQIAIAANVPVLVKGDPGVGKTSFFNQLAKDQGATMETIIASLRDPTDFGGLPIKTEDDEVKLAAPSWARRLANAADHGEEAWCFIDEITTAAPATQAALLRVIHERVVGDLTLPPNVKMIAAANPPEQAAGGWDLAPPLANRFFHYSWTVSPSEWADAMVQGFPPAPTVFVGKQFEQLIPKYRGLIGSFVRAKGQNLIVLPKDDSKAGGAWPSPRTWDMSARLLSAAESAGVDQDIQNILLIGTVGDGAAIEFFNWLKEQDLPNPEDLLANPSDFKLPDRPDKTYTVLASVVGATIGKLTPERYMAAWEILAKAAEMGADDVGAAAARTLAQHASSKLGNPTKFVKPFIPMLKEAGLIRDNTA